MKIRMRFGSGHDVSRAETTPKESGFSRCLVLAAALLIVVAPSGRAQQAPLPPGTNNPDQQSAPQSDRSTGPLADAENAIDAKNYSLAASRLDVYLSVHANDARALFDRGYIEDAQGHADAAEGWYRKAIAVDPKQFESHLALGLILAAKGDPAAKQQLQTATQLEPNPPNPQPKPRRIARLPACCCTPTRKPRATLW